MVYPSLLPTDLTEITSVAHTITQCKYLYCKLQELHQLLPKTIFPHKCRPAAKIWVPSFSFEYNGGFADFLINIFKNMDYFTRISPNASSLQATVKGSYQQQGIVRFECNRFSAMLMFVIVFLIIPLWWKCWKILANSYMVFMNNQFMIYTFRRISSGTY